MERKVLLVANWKMNPTTLKEAEHLFDTIKKGIDKKKEVEVVVCPPYIWLFPLINSAKTLLQKHVRPGRKFAFGSQDCFWERKGAYTSQVSSFMIKNLDCQYVIAGHSERRRYFQETDEMVNKKVRVILKAKLKPIICIGEEARDTFDSQGHPMNEMSLVIGDQLEKALRGISSSQIGDLVVAYEPIWAIGTGNSCSPDDAMRAALFVRKILTKLYDRSTADKATVLYGGSVNSRNAASYVKNAGIEGLLVGGASLNASEFIRIADRVTE